ncbi:hypothetical protein Q9L58_010105 [Maublancomyces gigas]|uniref:Ricin B lectin domain-containing protein n=1 Tax=Discina gigas TaxID=1032678 RepID=A0ABR3G543_9PEZI
MAPANGLYYISNVMNTTYYLTYLDDKIVASQDTLTLWDVKTPTDGPRWTTIKQHNQSNLFKLDQKSHSAGTPILFCEVSADHNDYLQNWTLKRVADTVLTYSIPSVVRHSQEIAMSSSPESGDNPVTAEALDSTAENHQWKFTLWV